MGLLENAESTWRDTLRNEPKVVGGILPNLAFIYIKRNDKQMAMQYTQYALDLNPNNQTALAIREMLNKQK